MPTTRIEMPYVLQQQSTPDAAPNANDLAAQIRAQVNQQLKQAGFSDQKAKSIADQAAQGATGVKVITKDGKTITIQTPGSHAPIAPLAPIAPIAVEEPDAPVLVQSGTSIPNDPTLDIPRRVENLGYGLFLMIAVIVLGKSVVGLVGKVLDRRALRQPVPPEFAARLERIEHGIESVSIEVERISESQRYLLKVQTPDRVEIPRSAS